MSDATVSSTQLLWRPSETAPKDGTHILVCLGPYAPGWNFNHRPPMVVHYWEYEGDSGFYLSTGIVADSYNDLPVKFTHWMPLPEVPT